MNNYSLSVYKFCIYKHLRKDNLEILTDYDNGSNFLKQIDTMFLSWKEKIVGAGYKDDAIKKVNRIKKVGDGWMYGVHETYIDGIIESGDYGTQEEIIDIETGESKYTKMPNDAALYPFYFMLYVKPNAQEGYLILERIGNVGIMSVLEKAIRDFLRNEWKENFIFSLEPLLVPKILEINFSKTGGAKRVILKGVSSDQFNNIQFSKDFDGCKTEISFTAPRNKMIGEIKDLIKSLRNKKDEEPYKVNNIECRDVAFELNVNGKVKTISMANVKNIGMNVDITNTIELDNTGYPSYAALSTEAHTILSYILG